MGQLGGRRGGRRQGGGRLPRSPQGRPLLVQAGSSPDGREFAARYAEAVFTAQLAKVLELPAERLELDRGRPEEVFTRPPVEGAQSRFQLITELARRDGRTVRQLIGRLGGGRGHRTFAGTPEQVADTIVEWAEAGAADGFNVMPPVLPSGLEAFTDHVIPLLRRRGVFRTEYTGRTLREHYGIPRPENVFGESRAPVVSMAGS